MDKYRRDFSKEEKRPYLRELRAIFRLLPYQGRTIVALALILLVLLTMVSAR